MRELAATLLAWASATAATTTARNLPATSATTRPAWTLRKLVSTPAHGRFTSPDPFSASAVIADPQTFNRYVYCRNNPVNSTDPTGMAAMAPMSQPTGERVSAAQGLIDTMHDDIQAQEAAWEETVRLAFLGIHLNESVTLILLVAKLQIWPARPIVTGSRRRLACRY